MRTEVQEANSLKNRAVVVVVLAAALVLAIGAVASAQTRIAVIDLAFIIDASKAGQQGNAILQQAYAERQQQVAELEAELAAMEEKLANQALSPEERQALLAQLEEAAARFEETVARLEGELQQLLEALRSQILSDLRIVVQMVAEQNNVDLIIDANQAYFFRETVDLTMAVLQLYDQLFDEARASGQ